MKAPLARKSVYADETFFAFSTKQVCGCDSLSRHRLAFLMTIRDTVGFYGRSLNPGNYPTAHRLEQRRRGGAGKTYAINPGGTASSGQTLHGGRAPGAHSANHGAGQRGLSAADRLAERRVAEPRPFLRAGGANHAAYPGGFRPRPAA